MDYILRKQISLLIELALSDNKFDAKEKAYLLRFAASKGATNSEVVRMINNPTPSGSLEMLSVTQKMDLLINCGMVVTADGVVEPEERAYLLEVSKKMGFKEAVVDYLLENVQELSVPELKEGFIPYVE